MNKKQKVMKIIFKASWIPHLLILLFGVYSSFFGFTFFWNTVYGFDAFFSSVGLLGFVSLPLLIPLTIYQIIYLIIKKRNRSQDEKQGVSQQNKHIE